MPKSRGGKRPGAGRKRFSGAGGELRHSRTFSITDTEYYTLKEYLARLRAGNLSAYAGGEKHELSEDDALLKLPELIESHRQYLICNYKSKDTNFDYYLQIKIGK